MEEVSVPSASSYSLLLWKSCMKRDRTAGGRLEFELRMNPFTYSTPTIRQAFGIPDGTIVARDLAHTRTLAAAEMLE
jgi:hypothetical protein